ncbi:MAG: thioesterase family protein [Bacteroidales bacterium]
MHTTLKPGIRGRMEITVQARDTAIAYGSGLVEVFATPAMIALMENTAHTSLSNFLSQEQLTVGTEVNIKHIKATGLGKKVWAESELLETDGKRLVFRVEAFDEDGKIGFGNHTRYIVDREKFMAALG